MFDGRRRRFAALTLCAAISLCAGPALAGPPFLTDDPEPVPYRHWEIYLAGQAERTAGNWSGAAPQVEVNYGAVPDLQLHAILPVAFSAPSGGPSTCGPGDVELGTKLRFIHEGRYVPQVGIFPLLELPAGSAARNLGTGHLHAYLPLWVQKSLGAWSSYGGGGYWINPGEGNRNYLFVGWQLQRQVTDSLALGGEIFHTTPQSTSQGSETRFNLGAILDVSEHQHLIASAGRGLQGPNRFQAYAAWLITLGAGEPARAAGAPAD